MDITCFIKFSGTERTIDFIVADPDDWSPGDMIAIDDGPNYVVDRIEMPTPFEQAWCIFQSCVIYVSEA